MDRKKVPLSLLIPFFLLPPCAREMNVAGTAKSTLLYRLIHALLHTMKKWFTIDYSIKTGSFKKANSIKEVKKEKFEPFYRY